VAAAVHGIAFTVLVLRQSPEAEVQRSRAFSHSTAFVFALTLSIMLQSLVSPIHTRPRSPLPRLLHPENHRIRRIPAHFGRPFSANTISKIIHAATNGGFSFTIRAVPGLILVACAARAGALYSLAAE
jgi:hypothetical protein